MAPNKAPETMGTHEGFRSSEIDALESELEQMAHKILEYRNTLPDQLKSTLLSLLEAQRPLSLPQPFLHPTNPAASKQNISTGEGSCAPEDLEAAEKVKLLNEKISRNLATMPVVLKRMKDCIAKIEKLESYTAAIIHPAFKRKKTG